MSDDGMWDICLKKKFKTEYDCYDTFLRECHKCKDKCKVILKCPYCKGKVVIGNNGKHFASCDECTYMSGEFDTEDQAIDAHNRLVELLEEDKR